VPEDLDLTELMNAVNRAGRVDQTLTRPRMRRDLSMWGFLHAYFPPTEARIPAPEQNLK
jgi:hypothetical protein